MQDLVKINNSKPDIISSFLGFRGQCQYCRIHLSVHTSSNSLLHLVKCNKCIQSLVFAGAIGTSVITVMAPLNRMNVVRWLTWLGGGTRASVGGGASTARRLTNIISVRLVANTLVMLFRLLC